MSQLCAAGLSLSVTRPGYNFTQQNRGAPVSNNSPSPSLSLFPCPSIHTPPSVTTCQPHYKSEKEERAAGSEVERDFRLTLEAAACNTYSSGETFTVHQPVRVGRASQACQTDGVLKLGQEERCSICCLARVNTMARWPGSTETLLCHSEWGRDTVDTLQHSRKRPDVSPPSPFRFLQLQ